MKKGSVDDYIKNILNSSSLDNEMKLSFQRKKAANNQPPIEHSAHNKSASPAGKFGSHLPLWATNEPYMPLLYKNICRQVLRENGHLDTNAIYTVFLSSGLPNTVLGLVWNSVNRTLPGELLPHELNLGLALIAVIQHQMKQGLCNNPQWTMPSVEQLCQLKDALIPQLNVPLAQTTTPQISPAALQSPGSSVSSPPQSHGSVGHPMSATASSVHQLPVQSVPPKPVLSHSPAPVSHSPPANIHLTEPDLPPPSYETAVSMMKSNVTSQPVIDDDDFGDFASSRLPTSCTSSTTLTCPNTSSQSGSSLSLSSGSALPQKESDFFSPPTLNTKSSDWADFSSFQSANTASVTEPTPPPAIKAPQLTLPLRTALPAAPTTKATPTVSKTIPTEEVDLPPSVEKHETVDRYAALRDELADFDHSSSGSDEMTTSPSGCDPASISSSRSSTNNDIHWTNSQFPSNKQPVPNTTPNQYNDDDEFTDFRAAIPNKADDPPTVSLPISSLNPPPPVSLGDEFGEFKQSGSSESVTPKAVPFEACFDALNSDASPAPAPPPTNSYSTKTSSSISTLNSILFAANDSDKKSINPNQLEFIDSIFKSASLSGDTGVKTETEEVDEFGSFSSAETEKKDVPSEGSKESPVLSTTAARDVISVKSGASRYDCISEEIVADRYETEWLRCLDQLEVMFKEASILFNEMKQKELMNEVLDTKKGSVYIQGLDEIYCLVLRINQAQGTFDVVNNKLHEKIASIQILWKSLTIQCPKLEIDFSESLGAILPVKSMTDSELCGVCLNSVSVCKLSPNVLSYGPRQYHCSCANFWVNCLDLTLPQLSKPHLI